MKKSFLKTAMMVLGLMSIGARTALAEPPEPDLTALARANNRFAVELYGRLRGEPGNTFLSPYSISTALAMTYAGARENTARQMADALHFDLEGDRLHAAFSGLQRRMDAIQEGGQVQLAVANSLWPEQSHVFLPAYPELAKTYYGVSITPLDYRNAAEAARRTINVWIEDRTRNKIRDMISDLDPLTRMVLVNAIYFKGNWLVPFTKEATEDQPFYTASGETVQAPLMTFQAKPGAETPEFGYWEDETLQVLELPYVGKDLAMVVLLPRKRDGLAELEEALSVANLERWTGRLAPRKVVVHLPKFKMTWGTKDLTQALIAMGMPDAFSPAKADFSGMDGNRPGGERAWLYISQVLHKAFVEVNEEGTEAAAATAVVMRLLAMPDPPPSFRADHPFLFLIREQATGSILFMGRVADPTLESGGADS